MGKAHRDNHAARVKRGQSAFDKKAKRREVRLLACTLCGSKVHIHKLVGGQCSRCATGERYTA